MNSIQCNIFHHQVAGTLSLDIWDQMMVHCHQHDCSIEFRPLLAVLLLLHNIEIDFLDTDHHRSIFALVGIKNRGIFQISSLGTISSAKKRFVVYQRSFPVKFSPRKIFGRFYSTKIFVFEFQGESLQSFLSYRAYFCRYQHFRGFWQSTASSYRDC